jgi:hypothetical protein
MRRLSKCRLGAVRALAKKGISVPESNNARTHVPWSLRITGWLHMLVLVGVGSLIPDHRPWWNYAIGGVIWLVLLLAGLELSQGRRIGAVILVRFHQLLFPAIVLACGYLFYDTFTMPDNDGRGPAIAVFFILPPCLLISIVSAMALFWTRRMVRRHFGRRGRVGRSKPRATA